MEFLFSAFLALLSKPLGISEARYTSHECLSSENMLLVFFYPETVKTKLPKNFVFGYVLITTSTCIMPLVTFFTF